MLIAAIAGVMGERPWEPILVDDGSTDDAFALIAEIAGRDPRVRSLGLSRNFGHQSSCSPRWSRVFASAAPGASPAARVGAVAFIHRFGALLNPHVLFHCVVVDGVLVTAAALNADETGVSLHRNFIFEAAADEQARFQAAQGPGPEALAEIQAQKGQKLLRQERCYGKVYRAFSLAQDVDEATAGAKYDNGVLVLTLPKKQAASAKKLRVE